LDELARAAVDRVVGAAPISGVYGTHGTLGGHVEWGYEHTLTPDLDAADRFGVDIAELRLAFDAARKGVPVAEVALATARVPVVVIVVEDPCPEDQICDVDVGLYFLASWAISGSRSTVPFRDVARIGDMRFRPIITRENRRRALTFLVGVHGRDPAAVATEVKAALAAELQLPSGYIVRVEEERD
jgi:Cu/Ag efflux pump CusA